MSLQLCCSQKRLPTAVDDGSSMTWLSTLRPLRPLQALQLPEFCQQSSQDLFALGL